MRMTSKCHKDEKLKAPSPGKHVEQLELSFTVERNGDGLHYRKEFIIHMPFLRFIQVKKNLCTNVHRGLINYHVKLDQFVNGYRNGSILTLQWYKHTTGTQTDIVCWQ